jgi:hypothetical protein
MPTAGELSAILGQFFLYWFLILVAAIAVRMLRNDINTAGLLKSTGSGDVDPERLNLLVVTLAGAGYYFLHTMQTPLADLYDAGTDLYVMPDIPEELLVIFAGSQGLFLSGKYYRRQ